MFEPDTPNRVPFAVPGPSGAGPFRDGGLAARLDATLARAEAAAPMSSLPLRVRAPGPIAGRARHGDAQGLSAALQSLSRADGAAGQAEPAGLAAQDIHGVMSIARDGAPDPRLIDALGARACLRLGLVPWRRAGAVTIIATHRPEEFARARPGLEALFGPVALALATRVDIRDGLLSLRSDRLRQQAETQLSAAESCRDWPVQGLRRAALLFAAILSAALMLAPGAVFLAVLGIAVTALVLGTALKAAAALAALRGPDADRVLPLSPGVVRGPLPMVSVMVPLLRERDIAGKLMQRLARLTYPRDRLEVLLVVEEDDAVTRATIAATILPDWMSVVVVPRGRLKTKPRALNFALMQCRGSIVGVYDAEDAPAPDQLEQIVGRFGRAAPDVACLQGVLDFYNPSTNWLSRCFTVEYATWFRLILPGYARLGLPIPLGGTTLFFRREILESLGGWDAHNVTEDADLGLRLARHGYRTELVATVTAEEANCRVWPWIRQRSRWIKGYAVTYAVHMRNPRRMWRDLGAWGFFGVQVVFLGSLLQALLAPFLWTFWAMPLGLWHPARELLAPGMIWALIGVFLLCEAVNISIGVVAVSGQRRHRFLRKWVPSLHFYHPLAAVAAYKGGWELFVRPFYWDKTAHGVIKRPARPR
jgi:cellulose synthase/poly-beta-1,6-N-acetylglucosamine synthase-like glycosyltransferase